MQVQYGSRTKMCDTFVAARNLDLEGKLKTVAGFKKSVGFDGIERARKIKPDPKSDYPSRQWWWQKCTQVGWMFPPTANSPLTSKK